MTNKNRQTPLANQKRENNLTLLLSSYTYCQVYSNEHEVLRYIHRNLATVARRGNQERKPLLLILRRLKVRLNFLFLREHFFLPLGVINSVKSLRKEKNYRPGNETCVRDTFVLNKTMGLIYQIIHIENKPSTFASTVNGGLHRRCKIQTRLQRLFIF